MAEENVQKLLDMLYEMIDEAKNAPPNVTSVVKVNSHLRPSELTSMLRSSSVRPMSYSSACPPCTNIRKTSRALKSEMMNHQ